MFLESNILERPTAVAYVGPSVTTYDNYNPSYRIYYVDGDHEKTTRVRNEFTSYISNTRG